MKPHILVILGPTATGKSDIAVQLAKKFNGEIVSADSRQVYRGMNLGSGKITKHEMHGIPHHLLDVVSPNTRFSVAQYKKLGEQAIEKIIAKVKLPIIVGGTGFYIDSLVKNISLPDVKPDMKLRKHLETKSASELFAMLRKHAPKRAITIDEHNKVRLIRAIEIAKTLGHVPEIKALPEKYEVAYIGLDMPDAALKERIATRLKKRLQLGMIEEVRKLHAGGVSWKRLESFGLEYRQIALLLQKKISHSEMLESLKKEIWHYVKRQRTWFKKNRKIQWSKPQQFSRIYRRTKKLLA